MNIDDGVWQEHHEGEIHLLRTIRALCIALLVVSVASAMAVGFIAHSVSTFHDRTLRIECEFARAHDLSLEDCR